MDYLIDTTTDQIHSTGGIALVGKICERIGFGCPSSTMSHPEILKSLVGLLVQGRTRYEEMELFRRDRLFRDSFGLAYVPAPETLRLYLERMEPEQVQEEVDRATISLLKRSTLSPIRTEIQSYLPVDVDTSPLDNSKSHKEGVSWTYKQFDGFHPAFSYIGREGYMLSCELREGKQHCQNGTPAYLERTIGLLRQLPITTPVLFRLDGGNDAKDTLNVLNRPDNQFFIVKRNLRRELPEYWLSVAQSEGTITHQDESKTVYTGFHTGKTPTDDGPDMDIIFEVTLRRMAHDGTTLLFPEVSVDTFWTNLYEPPQTVIALYRDHGTSEQFHSELKSDMNVERLPSGKFAVNAMILQVAMVAFNMLRFLGQSVLSMEELPYKTAVTRKRLRKVIDDLIRVAVKLVFHARQHVIKLWDRDPWLGCFRKLYGICGAL
ncbi:MAG: IS1380 family transposase [Spirochaeta sp.]|nr:IS1380 family transposase [Spirochaeta sp.]